MPAKTTKSAAVGEAVDDPDQAIAAEEPTQAIDPDEPTQSESPIYPTEFYHTSGIPYCKSCGEQLRTGLDGLPLCPIASSECDRHSED